MMLRYDAYDATHHDDQRNTAITNHRTEGCASNIARISVVPDRGTPPKILCN